MSALARRWGALFAGQDRIRQQIAFLITDRPDYVAGETVGIYRSIGIERLDQLTPFISILQSRVLAARAGREEGMGHIHDHISP